MFDTRDKIPNQYYVDIRVNTSGERDTYQKELMFQIVNIQILEEFFSSCHF